MATSFSRETSFYLQIVHDGFSQLKPDQEKDGVDQAGCC